MQEVTDELYVKSKSGNTFSNLMNVITSRDNILLAYRNIKRNNGSPTPGVDGITIRDIEKLNEADFINAIRKRFNFYNPRTIKRVEIPKQNGKKRPLGIPSLWDRLIQQCILQILEPICEARFNKHSYGFRPNRSTEHAIADLSVRKIHKHINRCMYNRFRKKGYTRKGNYTGKDKGLLPYVKSRRLRYLMDTPILPIGYIQTKNPMNKKSTINKYTVEGRKLIHNELTEVPDWKIKWLREHPVIGRTTSIEYFDNRISKFIAQKGKCAILQEEIYVNELHCHHITPYHMTKDDSYQNLIFVREDIHRLIHAKKQSTIAKIMNNLNLNSEMLKKLNKLREKVGNEVIAS